MNRQQRAPARFTSVEVRIDEAARALLVRLPAQGRWTALYGGALLALLMATALWYPAGASTPLPAPVAQVARAMKVPESSVSVWVQRIGESEPRVAGDHAEDNT